MCKHLRKIYLNCAVNNIDSILACVCVDINSSRDCAQWFDIDSLLTCVRIDIDC